MDAPFSHFDTASPDRGACQVCGGTDATGQLFVAFPRWEHMRCVDWGRRPFFFARHLASLRRVWRQSWEARPLLRPVGVDLAAMERAWAPPAAEVELMVSRVQCLAVQLRRQGVSASLLRGL